MTTILGLTIPEGQKLYFWSSGDDGTLLFAKDYDEAYSKCIQARFGVVSEVQDPEDVANAQRWFAKNDTLEEVVGEYTGPAYKGELVDPDLD